MEPHSADMYVVHGGGGGEGGLICVCAYMVLDPFGLKLGLDFNCLVNQVQGFVHCLEPGSGIGYVR